MNPEEATLRQLLTTANVPADVIDVIVLEGMGEFEACVYFSYKAVCAIALRKSRQPTPVTINTVSCWRIATVALYVQGKLQMGQQPDVNEFDRPMSAKLQQLLVTRENDTDKTVKMTVPFLTKTSEWLQFKEAVESYLGSIRGVSGIPLRYIIRDDRENQMFLDADDSWDTRLWVNALHAGAHYDEDKKKVFQLLCTKINCEGGTLAKAYFLNRTRVSSQDGRKAWEHFMGLYNSPNSANTRLDEADKQLSTLYFTGKKGYTFDEFANDLEMIFQVYMAAGSYKPESEKLRYFLSHCTAEKLVPTIADLQNKVSKGLTYVEALQLTTDAARRCYPDKSSSVVSIRNVGATGSSSFKKKKGKKKSKGKTLAKLLDVDGNLSTSVFCGVDVSDVSRMFTQEEYNKLKGSEIWAYIRKKREEKRSTDRQVQAATQIASTVVDTVLATQEMTGPQMEISGAPKAGTIARMDQATRDSLAQSIAFASASLMKKGGKDK